MDGNGRWARQRGLPTTAGHEAGVRSLRKLVDLCCQWGVQVLTVFAFSSENWIRPKMEVDFLLSLFKRALKSEMETFSRMVGHLLMLIWLEGRMKHCRGLKSLQLSVKHSHTRGARMVARIAYMVLTFLAKFLHG